jgi:hypothetical protein
MSDYLVVFNRHDGSSEVRPFTDPRELRRGMKIRLRDEPAFEVTATKKEPDGTQVVFCVPYPKEDFGPPVSANPIS